MITCVQDSKHDIEEDDEESLTRFNANSNNRYFRSKIKKGIPKRIIFDESSEEEEQDTKMFSKNDSDDDNSSRRSMTSCCFVRKKHNSSSHTTKSCCLCGHPIDSKKETNRKRGSSYDYPIDLVDSSSENDDSHDGNSIFTADYGSEGYSSSENDSDGNSIVGDVEDENECSADGEFILKVAICAGREASSEESESDSIDSTSYHQYKSLY